jgi:hypothetical protein
MLRKRCNTWWGVPVSGIKGDLVNALSVLKEEGRIGAVGDMRFSKG